MRPRAVALALFVSSFVGLAAVAGGCSSNGSAPAPAVDAGPGDKALGEPCDPAVIEPCVPLTDVCSASLCDPTTLQCVRVAVDAGPICGNTPPACSACDAGGDAGDAADAADAKSDAAPSDAGDASASEASMDDAAQVALDAASEAGDAEAVSDVGTGG